MKTFLSIGTGPGIGIATAQRFAREGYRAVLAARDGARLETLASPLREAGVEVRLHAVDAADASSVARLVADTEADAGTDGLDVLHYNAAALRQATLTSQPAASFNADLAVNIGGALAALQAAAPGMERRGRGTLLLTGGGFALQPQPDYLSLSIGKAGIRALVQGLFDDCRSRSIHIATVTVAGFTGKGDPEGIAEAFWALHAQPREAWVSEVRYDPRG